MKLISIVTPCYNEEENVELMAKKIKEIMSGIKGYTYEQIFIDNHSTDNTIPLLRKIAKSDKKVKVIINTRNFGIVRSPFYGLIQGSGDAVITLSSDFQDPPDLIPQFIQKWEEGFKVVLGVKTTSQESPIVFAVRKFYYRLLRSFAETPLVENATGFGLYDKNVIQMLRSLNDPYPYLRGLSVDLGYEQALITYEQPKRVRGISKNNFYILYDLAMLGFTSHSRIPLRLATLIGFISAIISFLVGLVYLIYKLIFWMNFSLGLAPVVVGLFFLGSVQLLFLGIVGEYIGAIYTQVLKRPLVVEKERINF